MGKDVIVFFDTLSVGWGIITNDSIENAELIIEEDK
jgi:hypothetical protein